MAKYNQKQDSVVYALESAANNLKEAMVNASNSNVFQQNVNSELLTASFESLDPINRTLLENTQVEAENIIRDALSSEGFNDIAKYQIEAGAFIAMAAKNPVAYNKAQLNARIDESKDTMSMESLMFGSAGRLEIAPTQDRFSFSNESFDEKNITDFLHYSILFNAMASRQDDVNALFFKPVTITPDQAGYTVKVRVEEVWNGVEHLPDGSVSKAGYRKLVDSLVHPEILETNLTDVIPYYQEGPNDNSNHFIDRTLFPEPVNRYLDDLAVPTKPLRTGMAHNLLGLSSHPALISAGLMNDKDSLDGRVSLSHVFIKVGEQLVDWNVQMLNTSGAFKSVEGNMRQMTINFSNPSLLVSNDLKAIDGTELATFKEIVDAGYELRLRVRLNGDLSVQLGNVMISGGPITVETAMKDNKEVPLDDKTLAPLLAKLKLENPRETLVSVEGYELEVRRTNFDLRTSGRMIDSNEYQEQVMIPLRSPICIRKPIGQDKQHPDVKALIVAARIQANNDGITTILNHAEHLKAVTSRKNYDFNTDREGIVGIGRHFIHPCYYEEDIYLPAFVNSVSSENRLKDIQGAVTTKLNEIIGRVLKTTNYISVVDQMTGGNPGKLLAAIATDFRLPQYLVTQGDQRLFGGNVDYAIASTSNKHMSNKIIMTLTRQDASEGPDPFSYGQFVWMPEFMVEAQMHRGSQTYWQWLVQPRYLHIVNLPILVVINMTGIEEVTGESTVMPVATVSKEDAAKYGNGFTLPTPAEIKAQTGANSLPQGTGRQPEKPATPAAKPAGGSASPQP